MEGGVIDPDAAILPVVRFVPWTVPTVVHSFTISACARVVLCIADSDQYMIRKLVSTKVVEL
jgi:hypothetical protein